MLFHYLFSTSCVLLIQQVDCQDWKWMAGKNTADALSTPTMPGARSGSSTWKDENGIVWMFGGRGYSDVGQGSHKLLNDLWKYNIDTEKWNLVSPGSVNKAGSGKYEPQPRQLAAVCGVTNITLVIFGGLDDNDKALGDTWVYFISKNQWLPLSKLNNYSAQAANISILIPEARGDMASWCRLDSLYIFGGMDDSSVIFSDMWKLSLQDLNWYEVEYSTNPNNATYNLGRNGATSWIGRGVLYMFGGNNQGTNIRNRHLNFGYTSDMWKFVISNNTWAYLNGQKMRCQTANYGARRNPSVDNHPGCRHRAAAWTDSNQQLWMYGGDGTDTSYPSVFHTAKLLADLWHYNTKHHIWTWMAGSNGGEAGHQHNVKNQDDSPGGRYEMLYWTGPRNTFYLMGGLGHDGHGHDGYLNDVWVLDVDYLVENERGISASVVLLFIFLATSLVFTMAGVYLYARDMRRPKLWNRFDHNIKYSKLTTNVDDLE